MVEIIAHFSLAMYNTHDYQRITAAHRIKTKEPTKILAPENSQVLKGLKCKYCHSEGDMRPRIQPYFYHDGLSIGIFM